jgi:hypothetical protein
VAWRRSAGFQCLLEHGVAEHDEPHRFLDPVTVCPEELLPAELAHEVVEPFVGADDERAAFVEDREEIAQPAALAFFMRDRCRVHGIDARLGARERQPAKGVEPVVEAIVARLDPAGLVHAHFIGPALPGGRDEAHLPAAFRANAVRCRIQLAERLERGPSRERRKDRVA